MKRFDIIETLHEGVNTFIHRAYQKDKDRYVIIKVLKDNVQTAKTTAKFKYEYEIAKELNIHGIIKYYELTKYNNNLALIMEDFQGVSLEKILRNRNLEIKNFLEISIKICDALANLHNAGVIHRDIKPSNIVINIEKGIVKIIDLGISSSLTRESYEIDTENTLKGTLAYISPEQTGRVNKKTDYRTDIYSLGVTLYEMLTGKLPFKNEDPAELVHAHIAINPKPPIKVKSSIPKVLSNIVMKCMRKNPDERYNSILGLKNDLDKCFDMLDKDGKVKDFELAVNDTSTIIKFPHKLYGRDKEEETLYKWLNEKPDNKVRLIMVSGVSGIGKTSLINEMHSKFLYNHSNNKVYFSSGIFDSFKIDMPYHAIIEAFEKIFKQILARNKEEVLKWKEKIENAIGDNGRVMTKFIPSLEYILGEQPRLIELSGEEAENRFNLIFNDFLKIFDDSYLYLFFDDMQNIDYASVKLIKNIMTDTESKNLTIIGVYGSNEVKSSHILIRMLNELEKQNCDIKEIKLHPISKESLSEMISDIFCDVKEKVTEFTRIVSEKTYRNPFFIISFLKMIYDNNLVWYNYKKNKWICDLEKIKEMDITDNVAEFMSVKVKHLSSDSQSILKLASVIGLEFNLKTLSYLYNNDPTTTAEKLNEPIKEGLILPVGDEYKYATLIDNEKRSIINGKKDMILYSFAHEKIYKGAYSLMKKEEREKLHIKIAEYLLNYGNGENPSIAFMKILTHYNTAINLIKKEKDEKRIIKVIRLNIRAAKKSVESVAFENALKYSRKAKEMFREEYWDNYYDIGVELFKSNAEYELLFGYYEESERCINKLMDVVETFEEKIDLYKSKITLYTEKGDLDSAFKAGKDAMAAFGIIIPEDEPTIKEHIVIEEEKIKNKLDGKEAEDIINLKVNDDKVNRSFTEITTNTSVLISDYMSNPWMSSLIILKGINYLLDNGNNTRAPYAYIRYSYFLLSVDRKDEAYQWGLMSTKLVEKFNDPGITKSVLNAFAMKINQIKNNIKTSLPIYKRAYDSAIKIGNYQSACTILANASSVMFDSGENLVNTLQYINNGIAFAKRIKNYSTMKLLIIIQKAIMNLSGLTKSIISYDCGNFDEKKFVEDMKKNKFYGLSWYYYAKVKTLTIYGKYEQAIEVVENYIKDFKRTMRGSMINYFLSIATIIEEKDEDFKKIYYPILEEIAEGAKSNIKSKGNYVCREYLTLAEYYRLKKKYGKAIKFYDKAIRNASKNHFIIEKAKANEFAGHFYNSIGSKVTARMHLNEAHNSYKLWEAEGKVKQMENKYPFFLKMNPSKLSPYYTSEKTTSSVTITREITDNLDLSSVIKFSQAISGEIVTESLLKSLMKIVIENGGAQKGYIILNRGGNLRIEAEGNAEKSKIVILKSIPFEESSLLPVSIINYVERTKEDVVLNNAPSANQFRDDAYILKYKPLSVLAIPFIEKGKLAGILYLENRIISGAFTRQRIEVLKLLSTQIAISIENAKLYEQLEDYSKNLEIKVLERTAERNKTHEELTKNHRAREKELEMAKRVQDAIILEESKFPSTSKLRMAAHYSAMDKVGGDLYDVIKIDDYNYGFLISDVSGHGVPASLITTMAKVSFTSHINPDLPPNKTLDMVNFEMCQFIGDLAYFLTAYYCIINVDTGELRFSNSGHHPAILYHADTGETESLDTNGCLIGVVNNAENGLGKVYMKSGDRLLLFTDGITEARDKEGKFYTYERLMNYIRKNSQLPPKEFVNGLIRNLNEFTGGIKQEDDRTILYIEYVG